jgi:hypothetical protein
MATATPLAPHPEGEPKGAFDESEHEELVALRAENKELRELVIQLSKLVIRNVLEHK